MFTIIIESVVKYQIEADTDNFYQLIIFARLKIKQNQEVEKG